MVPQILDTCVIVCLAFELCVCVCVCLCVQSIGEDTSRDLGDRSRSHLDIVNGEDYM